ncbi:MAG: ABC transporter permease subunit [Pirellula sp.]
MFRILLKKYIGESIWLWCACAAVLFFFPWVRIWTVSQFELSGFEPILKQFRAFEKFSPVPLEQFLTYHGIIGFTFDEPVLILCVLVWSIARGSDVVSGELGRGTMEMLLSQPVGRGQLMAAHAVVTITGLALLCLLVYCGLFVGLHTNATLVRESSGIRLPILNFELSNPFIAPKSKLVPLTDLVSASVYIVPTWNLFALGFLVLGLSVMVSAFDQYRWRTIGIVIGVYVLQLLLFVLSKSTPKLSGLKPLSFLAAYQPDWIVQKVVREPEVAWAWTVDPGSSGSWWMRCIDSVGPVSYVSILLALGCITYMIGYFRFRGRDLPAPQ